MLLPRRDFILSAVSGAASIPLLPRSVAGQDLQFAPFLGNASLDVPDKVTPRFHIRYNARGFDHGRRKRIERKTPKYLAAKGASHLIEEFQMIAEVMTSDDGPRGYIPLQIDLAYSAIKQKWIACGGNWASVARRFDPERLYIDFEAQPFWVPEHATWANGSTNGHHIRIVAITANKLFSDPAHAFLVRFESLATWEIGNAFGIEAGIPFTGIKNEIGDQSPCGPRLLTQHLLSSRDAIPPTVAIP